MFSQIYRRFRQNSEDTIREYAFRVYVTFVLSQLFETKMSIAEQEIQDRRDVGCKHRDVDIDFSAVCTSIVECALYIMSDCTGVRNVGYAVAYAVTRGIDERVCKITSCSPRCYRPRT